jgi:micrococcal nuclease
VENQYEVKILKVVDGDTVDVDIDLGFGITLRDERVRIMGIDTPESRTSDKVEKVFGLAAKERLKELLGKDAILITTENKHGEDMKGKFGRVLGDFKVNDKRVTEILIEEGHAVKYFGQNKADIESGHISNRHKLMHEGVIDPADVQKAEEEMK